MHDTGMVRFTGPFFPNPLVDTAKALWDNLWDMTAINEQAFPKEPNLKHILQYGNWETRGDKALKLLRSFYEIYFGEPGAQTFEKFMQSRLKWQRRSLSSLVSNDPALLEATAAYNATQSELDELLGGVRVTNRAIEVPEGHESLSQTN